MSSSSDLFEAQATACLQAAQTHYKNLLAVALNLTRNPEQARELVQDTVLQAHDTIQRLGFEGENYHHYLFRALRNRHYEHYRLQCARAEVELSPALAEELCETDSISSEARLHLAQQLQEELARRYSPEDVALLTLHSEGHSYRDIAQLTDGGDYSWIRRKVERMKAALSALFRPHFEGLS